MLHLSIYLNLLEQVDHFPVLIRIFIPIDITPKRIRVNICSLSIIGGATVWPFAGVSQFHEKGSGVFWYNLFRNSDLDEMSSHASCGILQGGKWIGNKWIGYNNQWNTKMCGLSEIDTYDDSMHLSPGIS